jgi:mono/diheme cytochrome c family protein
MMRKAILVVASALLFGFFGCGKKSTESTTDGALDGEKLVQERCASCHGLDRIDSADKDRDGWEKTVDQMISKGAQVNDAERQAVIDYLSNQ